MKERGRAGKNEGRADPSQRLTPPPPRSGTELIQATTHHAPPQTTVAEMVHADAIAEALMKKESIALKAYRDVK